MNREECIAVALELITADRANIYGEAEASFLGIAKLWSAYLGIEISPKHVGDMMILLKINRSKTSNQNDDYIDICGYSALTCEIIDNK